MGVEQRGNFRASTSKRQRRRGAQVQPCRPVGGTGTGVAEEMEKMVADAVRCHFEERERPQLIRLHFVRQEVFAL
jgi:hypothetical protein